jgi:hypothetical protein
MEGRQEGVEPLDRADDLSSLGGEVEAVARGNRSMQQCPRDGLRRIDGGLSLPSSRPTRTSRPQAAFELPYPPGCGCCRIYAASSSNHLPGRR